jgi:hypothetical protein
MLPILPPFVALTGGMGAVEASTSCCDESLPAADYFLTSIH